MSQDKIDRARARYEAALHAVQSGVAAEMGMGSRDTEPKHLRVGVNSALVDASALATLLMRNGIITELEYLEAIADGMEAEARRYEKRLADHFGRPVTLA